MKIIKRIKNIFRKRSRIRNTYEGTKSDRFTADWMVNNLTSDEILRTALPTLRQRSRDLAINNDYAKNFFRKIKVNVVGPVGIGLQSKARRKNGKLDKTANTVIEAAWKKWIKKRYCSVCGTQSLKDILTAGIESIARDGEVIIRKVKGFKNPFRFALQLIEADHLDERLNKNLTDGWTLKLGIEKNEWGKPVRYHLFKNHPGDRQAPIGQRYITIPANEIIHPYIRERPSQSRGVPWIHTAILRLRMLGSFEEAALVNARIGASKMGFLIPDATNSAYEGDSKDSDGNTISEVEPGLIEKLPPGYDFKNFDPGYPQGEFQPFQKAMLRGIASGIGCSYNSLANDLEGVNFSSLRSGALEERDLWRALQSWFIESVLDEIFPEWLEMAIMTNQVSLNYMEIERLTAPKWQARTWDWVDPLKDMKARSMELDEKITSRHRVCAERGIDFEEVLEELAEEKKMMEAKGIAVDTLVKPDNKDVKNLLMIDEITEAVMEQLKEENLIGGNGRH